MSIPNLITLARILLVPVLVWAIIAGEMRLAFLLFLAAGISDAVDGFLAKRFGMATELGAYLDPLADKVLIVSIYVALGITGVLPAWLVILVVSRDIMIVGAVLLSWLVDHPVAMKPVLVSKAEYCCTDRLRHAQAGFAGPKYKRGATAHRDDGAGRYLDPAFNRILSARMDPPHEFGRSPKLNEGNTACAQTRGR